jgi:hypothetical protein
MEESRKMTAVEWLAIALYENFEMVGDGNKFDELLKKAKEMEKGQIIEARLKTLLLFKKLREKHGYFGGYDNGQVIDREINESELYYTNTFKSE